MSLAGSSFTTYSPPLASGDAPVAMLDTRVAPAVMLDTRFALPAAVTTSFSGGSMLGLSCVFLHAEP